MKNKCFLLGIFSMLLIFSFLIMGCDEEIEDTYYTVTFNNNGGTGSAPSSQTVLAGSAITLPSGSGLSRSGHNFGGWNVNAAGSGTNYSAGASYTVNSNITLYARWVSTSITITLPKNDYADHSSLWQCIYDESSLLNGTRIMTGDVYVFNYSFRSNRNLDRLAVMLVDTTATAGYWTMLSDNFVIGVNIPANTDITGTITFAITTSATSTARAANALVFQAGEGTPSSPTLTFSSFVFGKPGSSHTVTFNSNGGTGTVPSSQTVSSGSSITLPGGSGLTRSGFTFGGWNTNASGTGTNYNVGATYTPTGNVTLYAKWDVIVSNNYTVTFNNNGGTGTTPSSQTVPNGTSIILPSGSGLSRSGYTFAEWNTNSAGTGTNYSAGSSFAFNSNVTLYARWNAVTTVTFNSNGGSSVESQTVNSGSIATRPADPTRTGFTFDNWYSNSGLTDVYNFSTPVTSNITLYAKWNVVTTTVTFNSNGGSSVESQTVNSGSIATRPADPIRTGFTFDNWYSNSGLTDVYNFSTPVTSNITLYAKWNVVTTTVTFNSNGGSAVESQTVNSGSIATLPADPTRTGYTFDNWYSNSGLTDVYNFSTPVTSNITLYAKWNVIINYTVTFHANEGSGTVPGTQSITAGSVFTIPEITGLSRAGYTLVGWTLNSAGTGTIYKAGDTITPNNDTTLYAKWNLTSIVVSFDANVEPVLEKPIIHRSASNGPVSETFTLDNPEQYDSISWRILNTNVTGTGHTFTLSTANSAYNTAGEYILTVEVKIGNAWFNRTINFTVAE